MLDLDRLRAATVRDEPFRFFSTDIIDSEQLPAVLADFPTIHQSGLFPVEDLSGGLAFDALVEALRSPAFEAAMEEKLGLSLADKSLMITVRGRCAERDGRPHTDSEDKAATALIYLNPGPWEAEGGRIRLLNSADLDDVALEVAPRAGVMVAFRRSDRSWHGHPSFVGQRRYLMLNWLVSDGARAKHFAVHKLSSAAKKLGLVHAR
ncbi:2OG-Fe(II) oxygenase [Phenylobacterium montanum]|uniref:2OG-Fe(II) oxygenase n=1 Tax=Phenylobacterium montanum TaxID=2823693 RepID=A0A975IUH6_9CAUL|nr:2OG-Fe(II) oxygenase [Caulobacter sp. S6]QUD87539.1 2OG-Fe(II) oxygenase [Caulobacter sp. S6]